MDFSKLTFECEVNGYKVYSDESLLITITEEVPMSLTERLFSLPWRPFVKSYTVTQKHPDPKVYTVEGNIIAHPATVQELTRAILAKINEQISSDR